VCLCPAFPPVPLRLRGACVALQHPCEAKRKLATVPLLRRAIDARDFLLVRGRRFEAEPAAPALHALLRRAAASSAPVLVLWPRAGVSVGVGRAMRGEGADAGGRGEQQEDGSGGQAAEEEEAAAIAADRDAPPPPHPPPPPALPPLAYLLIAIDGTWVQAQEMSGPLARWICKKNGGPAVLVHLDAEGGEEGEATDDEEEGAGAATAAAGGDAAAGGKKAAAAAAATTRVVPAVVGDPALRWRTEPLAAGMSTCEAVARALEVCEAHAAEAERQQRRRQQQRQQGAAAAAAEGTAATTRGRRRPARPGAEAAKEGKALRAALVAPIARMVALQVKYDPSMRARTGQRPAEDDAAAAAAAPPAEEGGGGRAAGGGRQEEGGGGGGGGGEAGERAAVAAASSGAYIRPSSRFRAGRRQAKALRTADVVGAAEGSKGQAGAEL